MGITSPGYSTSADRRPARPSWRPWRAAWRRANCRDGRRPAAPVGGNGRNGSSIPPSTGKATMSSGMGTAYGRRTAPLRTDASIALRKKGIETCPAAVSLARRLARIASVLGLLIAGAAPFTADHPVVSAQEGPVLAGRRCRDRQSRAGRGRGGRSRRLRRLRADAASPARLHRLCRRRRTRRSSLHGLR